MSIVNQNDRIEMKKTLHQIRRERCVQLAMPGQQHFWEKES